MPSERESVRFGTFEVNLDTGEVRRSGVKVRLQEQPFQVLAALLEKPGEIVTKEELQERIWKDDTFVDFDRSLATAINKVRQALGDSATRPRFIETVPKRGYRFVGLGAGEASSHQRPQAKVEEGKRRRWVTITAALAALVALGWWAAGGRESTNSWSEPRRVTADSGLTIQPTISRDGALIAYASDRAGNGDLDIWVQRTDGRDPIRITDDPGNDASPHFSPDGETVVFESDRNGGGIYVAPSLGGFPRLLAPARGNFSLSIRPRFSPDGEFVAYMSGARLFVVPVEGGGSRRLSPEGLIAHGAVWSPEGNSLLAFTSRGVFDEASYEWRIYALDGEDRGPTGAYAEIRRQLPIVDIDDILSAHYWDRDGWVAFSIEDADSVDLWRIQIDPQSGLVDGPPSRILGGPGQFTGAGVSDSGRIVVANEASDADIWSLSIDANRAAPLGTQATRLVRAPGADIFPSISTDGRLVLFQSERSGEPEQWVLSVADRTTRAVSPIFGHSILSASGERIAVGWTDSVTIVTVEGLIEQTLDGPGGYPWHLSPDESLVLYNVLEGRTRGIWTWDRESGETAALVAEPDSNYFQGQFSPDGRWVAWQSGRFGVEAAPFRGLQRVSDFERVLLSPEGWRADKPRWSPDGNVMYFVSRQDGYDCLYAQPLDPDSKQPRGEIAEIYHSHESSISIRNVSPVRNEISLTSDRIIFGMGERTSNIWVVEPQQ